MLQKDMPEGRQVKARAGREFPVSSCQFPVPESANQQGGRVSYHLPMMADLSKGSNEEQGKGPELRQLVVRSGPVPVHQDRDVTERQAAARAQRLEPRAKVRPESRSAL
jgi:hypothetical protein